MVLDKDFFGIRSVHADRLLVVCLANEMSADEKKVLPFPSPPSHVLDSLNSLISVSSQQCHHRRMSSRRMKA